MATQILRKCASKLWPQNLDDQQIEFLGDFIIEKDSVNGFVFKGFYIPEEIMLNIFANLSPKDILNCSLVCKNWFNLAKSNALWQIIYNNREYPKKGKNLPWYVYYSYFTTENFKNLIKNGNGEEQFKYWEIVLNGGDKFIVEKEPIGSPPLPEDVPEFHGHTSCFATSFSDCLKYQKINLKSKRLLKHIIRKYKPALYASEWYTGRFDCGSVYKLTVSVGDTEFETPETQELSRNRFRRDYRSRMPASGYSKSVEGRVDDFVDKPWEKLELLHEVYPKDVDTIFFSHLGRDIKYWKGHYGSKMAGGVLKFVFESIQPAPEDTSDNDNMIAFKRIRSIVSY